MAGILKVDQVQSDSNLAFAIAGSNVAFMNATSLQMVGSNVSLAGTNVITNGKVVTSAQPTGAVLQVVSNTISTSISTTSGAYVTTGLTASITPSSASSKILVLVNCASMFQNGGGNQLVIAIFRGATNLHAAAGAFGGQLYSTALIETSMSMMILDSPATTSSTTYTVHYAAVSGTASFNQNTGNSYIILQEIAG